MADKTIITNFFRIGPFANLAEPYAGKPGDTPKFGVSALFPKNGITAPTGQATSGVDDIIAALNEVCQTEFKVDYATLLQHHTAYGIQHPPKFVDGDQDWQKDDKKNPIIGQVRQGSVGMWKIPMKSADHVDLVAPNGNENISAAQVSPGYWARAQISVSAYTNKQGQRVLSIKLLNLQLAYTDEKLASGGAVKQEGTQAFGSMAVGDTNVQAALNGIPQPGAMVPGAGSTAMPVPGGVPQSAPQQAAMVPGAMPQQSAMPAPGAIPGGVPQQAAMVPGMMPQQATMPAPGAVPGVPQQAHIPQQAAMVPGAVPGGGVPLPGAAPGAVPAPPPQQAAIPQTRVIMNQGEHPYQNYIAGGWTDEMLVQHGKGTWNMNYVG